MVSCAMLLVVSLSQAKIPRGFACFTFFVFVHLFDHLPPSLLLLRCSQGRDMVRASDHCGGRCAVSLRRGASVFARERHGRGGNASITGTVSVVVDDDAGCHRSSCRYNFLTAATGQGTTIGDTAPEEKKRRRRP